MSAAAAEIRNQQGVSAALATLRGSGAFYLVDFNVRYILLQMSHFSSLLTTSWSPSLVQLPEDTHCYISRTQELCDVALSARGDYSLLYRAK